MTLELLAALGAALSVFVAVGALTGQFSFTERRIAARTAVFQRGRDLGEEEIRKVLLKDDEFSQSRAFSSLLANFRWAPARAMLLEHADLPLKVGEYLLVAALLAGLTGAVAWALSGLWPVGIGMALATILGLETWVRSRARRRMQLFERQLPLALQVMSTSLKSGFSIMESVATVAREMDPPIAEEFTRLLDETRVGGSFEAGVEDLVERIDSADLRIVARALEIHREVGGDLTAILDQVAATMRERDELRGHVQALTAQQRLGGLIVGLLPAWVVTFFLMTDPDFISPLWTEPVGRLLLAIGLGLEITAFFALRRIMSIEV